MRQYRGSPRFAHGPNLLFSMNRSQTLCSGVALFATLTLSCSGSGAGNGTSGTPDPLAAELRAELAAEGIGALPAAPTIRDELFALGEALFYDKILSGNRNVSCATCHLPQHAGADGRTLPSGVGGTGIGPARSGGEIIPRNSPTVLNTHLLSNMFWDARVEPDGVGGVVTPATTDLTPAME